MEIATAVDAELAKERSRERHQHLPRSVHRAVYDPAAPLDAQGETTSGGIWITKDVPILWIDYISIKGKLLGVWQAFSGDSSTRLQRNESPPHSFLRIFHQGDQGIQNIKFVVKVNRGARAPEYVQRVDPTPTHVTTNRKLALVMGRLTAEDAIESLGNSRVHPRVGVGAG